MGHPAYDVASLLQDARVTVPAELELKLLGLYARERARPPIRASTWRPSRAPTRSWARSAPPRSSGIFARLDRRDGKPHYLEPSSAHRGYLARNLAHPALAAAERLVRDAPAAPRRRPGSEP